MKQRGALPRTRKLIATTWLPRVRLKPCAPGREVLPVWRGLLLKSGRLRVKTNLFRHVVLRGKEYLVCAPALADTLSSAFSWRVQRPPGELLPVPAEVRLEHVRLRRRVRLQGL